MEKLFFRKKRARTAPNPFVRERNAPDNGNDPADNAAPDPFPRGATEGDRRREKERKDGEKSFPDLTRTVGKLIIPTL